MRLAGYGLGTLVCGGLLLEGGRQILPRLELSSLAGNRLTVALLVLGVLLLPLFLFSSPSVVRQARRLRPGRRSAWHFFPLGLLGLYALYWGLAAGAPLQGLFRMTVAVAIPWLLAGLWPAGRGRETCVLLVAFSIWLPLESGWLRGAFPWPSGGGARTLGLLLGLDLLLYLLLLVRGLDDMGYRLGIRRRDLPVSLGAFAVFALLAIPLGLSSGFLGFHVRGGHLPELLLAGIGLFLATGVPEEALFRGVLQRFLERQTGRPGWALLGSALLFGLAHANNGSFLDWRFVGLAALAGVAYGWVYRQTGRIGPAALTHALVDLTWLALFTT